MTRNIIVVDDTPKYQEMLSMFRWIEYEDGTHVINPRYIAERREEHVLIERNDISA